MYQRKTMPFSYIYEHPIKILFQEMYMLSLELLKDNLQLEELCYVVDAKVKT